ncbi:MAG: HlyD family efflux transporter periplasmic adaptor subunit [Clostridia bacterium]|nr:HlyD family efflux transporter periplasmic adaptor subunit [Clostridia bacterium]
MKKKVLLIIFVLLLVGGSFIIGRQVGLNTEDSKTSTIVKEETVGTQDIKKTLTSSGEVSAKTTEKLDLTTSYYFKTMCVEDDDTVKEGENLLQYTNGTYLTAPYDLVVISHSVPEADSKCTSSNYIEVSNLKTLTTTLSINENEINSVQVGQEVAITLTADESKTYTGKVTKVDSVGTYAASGTTFSATVEFENDGNVKLGMSLSCTITLKEEKEVVCVPIDAVYQNKEGKDYVVKVNSDGTTTDTIVELGIANDNYVQVKSGLSLNDKVQITTEVTESTQKSNSNSSGFGGFGGGSMPGGDFSGGNMPNFDSSNFKGFSGSDGGKPSRSNSSK